MSFKIGTSKNWKGFVVISSFVFFAIASLDEDAPPPAAIDRLSLNVAGKSGSVEVKVTKVKTLQTAGDPTIWGVSASEGGVYVAIHWSVKNISKKPLGMFSQPSIELVSNDGVSYEWDLDASTGYSTEVNIDEKIISDLNPGITVKSAEVFEVSKELFDTSTWSVKINTDDGALWFNLQ